MANNNSDTSNSPFTAGTFLFVFDKGDTSSSAYVKSVEGGHTKGNIVEEQHGASVLKFHHLSTVEVEPITVELGLGASKDILTWIADTWQHNFVRHSGSILHAPYSGKTAFSQTYTDALLEEATIPDVDANSNDAAFLKFKVQPYTVDNKDGDGAQLQGNEESKQKLWLKSNFTLSVDGFDCSHVTKVDALTVKQKLKALHTGRDRFPVWEAVGVELPKLTFEIPLSHASDFLAWHKDYVIDGKVDTEQSKRDGALTFMDHTLTKELMTVTFQQLGLHNLTIDKSEANKEAIKNCKVELFFEEISLTLGDGFNG